MNPRSPWSTKWPRSVAVGCLITVPRYNGLVGTDWEGPAYRIPLTDYQPLEPPLPRVAFLETEPFATELRELAESGVKGLFYNSRRGLNQGAYLTEAAPILLSVLNHAYQAHSGEPLPYVEAVAEP